MTILNHVYIGIAATFAAAAVVLLYRKNIHKTMTAIEIMIDDAINGKFAEHAFDESVLSSVEDRLAQFLSICSVSSTNLLVEKNKINKLISDISHQTKTPVATSSSTHNCLVSMIYLRISLLV
ncbi:hypothetical protein D1872_230150 [compost metagenome]